MVTDGVIRWYSSGAAVTSSGGVIGEDDLSPCFMLTGEISSELFPVQEAGAVALASRGQTMSRYV